MQPWQRLVLDVQRDLVFPERGCTIKVDVKKQVPCRCLSLC